MLRELPGREALLTEEETVAQRDLEHKSEEELEVYSIQNRPHLILVQAFSYLIFLKQTLLNFILFKKKIW